MQIGGTGHSAAAEQISRSTQMMNNLNQKIVDSHQEMSGKLVGMAAEAKVQATQAEVKGNALNMLA